MTYLKIITILQNAYGVDIDYHFNVYTYQRRLIVDKIEGVKYNNTPMDQNLARFKLRELEVKCYGQKDKQ